jgi:hypothetical protein
MTNLAVLKSTHLTLKAEKAMGEAGIAHRTVMKPRSISSDCGLAIRFEAELRQKVSETLLEKKLVPARLFESADGDWSLLASLGDETGEEKAEG